MQRRHRPRKRDKAIAITTLVLMAGLIVTLVVYVMIYVYSGSWEDVNLRDAGPVVR